MGGGAWLPVGREDDFMRCFERAPGGRGLHPSIFSAQRKHFLWDTLGGVSLSVTNSAQVELKSGRV